MSPRFNRTTAGAMALLAALVLGQIPPAAHAQGSTPAAAASQEIAPPPPFASQIGFFRKVLSKADGNRCAMHPSCSTYALDSLRKHGALMGWVMACDRLLRCGHDEVRLAPVVRVGQRRQAYDPVSGNDFWWWSPPQTAPTAGP